jgi:hypothetical protein
MTTRPVAVVAHVVPGQNASAERRELGMIQKVVVCLVELLLLTGAVRASAEGAASAPAAEGASKPKPAAIAASKKPKLVGKAASGPAQSQTNVPRECLQQDRPGADCPENSSAGILARVWSRSPNESPEILPKCTGVVGTPHRVQGAAPTQTLVYEVCNLTRTKPLYFQWVVAGFQIGSAQENLLRYYECACFDREVTESTHGTKPFEAGKPLQVFNLETYYPPAASLPEHLFDIAQSFHIRGLDRSGQSKPKRSYFMRTLRENADQVKTQLSYEQPFLVLIALPKLDSSAEAQIREQLRSFPGTAEALSKSDALKRIADNDRQEVGRAFEQSERVLVLVNKHKTSAEYSWLSTSRVLAYLPVAIADQSGRLHGLIHYTTVGTGR